MFSRLFTHFVIVITPIAMAFYVLYYPNPQLKANNNFHYQWHPILMTTAFVLFMGEAILSFRVLGRTHDAEKYIHFGLHTLAIATAFTGFTFIYKFHHEQESPMDDFYNIHGTIGLGALILYAVQYILGALSFLIPKPGGLPVRYRAMIMPYHKWLGLVIFFFTFAALLTGIMDRQRIYWAYYKNPEGINTADNWDGVSRMSNAAGALIFTSALLILYHLSPASAPPPPVNLNNDMETRLLP